MKSNNLYRAFSICLVMVAFICAPGQANAQTNNEALSLSLSTEKDNYVPGEVVNLNFSLLNLSERTLTTESASVEIGNLRLFISEDGENYREYVGPGWGMKESPFQSSTELEAGAEYEATATLLFNQRIPTDHLTELYAQQIRAARIDTAYALTRAGRYFLKAVLKDSLTKSTIESRPVEVLINEPVGTDGLVWERLKENPEYAYFLQTGHFRGGPAEAEPLIGDLTELVENYPDSIYAPRINANLDRLRNK